MKGFLYNVLAFLLIWAGIFCVLYLFIPRKYYGGLEYEVQTVIYKKMSAGGVNGNILLGDSRTEQGLDGRCINAVNFSLGGMSPVEGYYQLRQILQNKTNHIDTVFISYTLAHLLTGQTFFYTSTYYNGLVSRTFLDSVRQLARQYNDDSYAFEHSKAFPNSWDKLMNDPVKSARIRIIREFAEGGMNSIYEYLKRQTAGHKTDITGNTQLIEGRMVGLPTDTIQFKRSLQERPTDENLFDTKQSAINRIYLQKMLTLAKEHNVQAVFIFMPCLKAEGELLIQKKIASLDTLFSGNVIYDTSYYKDTEFRDNRGHMNNIGVNKFQAFLVKKLYDHSYDGNTAWKNRIYVASNTIRSHRQIAGSTNVYRPGRARVKKEPKFYYPASFLRHTAIMCTQ